MSDHQPLAGPGALLLIATCALAASPFFVFQPASFTALALLLFAWRIYLSRSRLISPPKGLLVLIGLLGAALALFEYRTIFGREAGLALLSLLLPLKLLEARSTRDARVAMLLCCFLLTGQFLLAQTLLMASIVLGCTLCILATTASIQQPGLAPRQAFARALRLLGTGTPLMIVFFLFFPRIDGPLWRLPIDTQTARAGLSDSMRPGSISSLIESAELAFWVNFEQAPPPASQLYWRAMTLSTFDGQTWRAGEVSPVASPAYPLQGPVYTYTLILEAHDQPWLPALDYPAGDPAGGRYLNDFSLRSPTPVSSRKRYALQAFPQTLAGLEESARVLSANLRLPRHSNPRTRNLGRTIATRAKDPAERVRQGVSAMRQANLVYTLNPPALGQHSADEFLFDSRRGFCEHFSSAFVILMRAAGVPARVVTGYQGGEINPVDGTLIVRQSDAHAWAEVWLAGRGWQRVDPTAASAPRRIEQGISEALPAGEVLPLSLRADFPWLRNLRHRWEALNHGWNQWVLGYNAARQLDFMRAIGLPDADWRQLIILLGSCAAIWMAWLSLRALPRRPRLDPLDRHWQKFCARLKKAGLHREPWEPPSVFAQRAAQALPSQEEEIRRITEEYAILRYGPRRPAPEELARLKTSIDSFKPLQPR